jgi:hypothetical protein
MPRARMRGPALPLAAHFMAALIRAGESGKLRNLRPVASAMAFASGHLASFSGTQEKAHLPERQPLRRH